MSATVVLLHALATDPGMWAEQERALASSGHAVLVPDLYRLAAGTSGPPSLDALADALAGVIDRAGCERVVLVGCSLGGYLAMAFLRRYRDRVEALALVGTRADADDATTRTQRLAFADRITDPALAPALTAAIATKLLGAGTRRRQPWLLQHVEDVARSLPLTDIAHAQRAIADREASYDVLAAFTGPTVVLVGAEDELVCVEDARRMAEALPTGHLLVVPDAGHLLPLEAPRTVDAILASLLIPINHLEREVEC